MPAVRLDTRHVKATFKCSTDDCWLEEYQADVNGAITKADRYRSGESYRQSDGDPLHKADDVDSATDGASLTEPHDSHPDAETQQVTPGTYAS